jgi:ribosomal protein L11 methyltransferase
MMSARSTKLEFIDFRLPIVDCRSGNSTAISLDRESKSEVGNRQSAMSESAIRNSSSWLLVTLNVSRDAEETASALLFDMAANGIVTLEESDDRVTLGAYFDRLNKVADIKPALEAEFSRLGLGDVGDFSISPVPEQDWMQKWKEGFEPVEVGERLIVAPSWKLPDDTNDRVVIQIDPGMAFGTGTHETTRLCLEAIERHWAGSSLLSLLDVGTGTGILAIAAAKLVPGLEPGFRPGVKLVAIDVDPQAVEVARENTAINNVSDLIELNEGQPSDFRGHAFDVVVANLTAEVIVDLMSDLAACLAQRGLMILSGILSEVADDVERALVASGFEVIERHEAGEWSLLVSRRHSM